MRTPKRTTDRCQWTKEDLRRAIFLTSRGVSRREAAHLCGIPRGTLRRRLIIGDYRGPNAGRGSIFNNSIEREFVEYTVDYAHKYSGLTCSQLCKLAFKYAEKRKILHPFNTKTKSAGRDWCSNFLKKNPKVKAIIKRNVADTINVESALKKYEATRRKSDKTKEAFILPPSSPPKGKQKLNMYNTEVLNSIDNIVIDDETINEENEDNQSSAWSFPILQEATMVEKLLKLMAESNVIMKPKKIRIFAFYYAWLYNIPHNFDTECQIASGDWLKEFMERNPIISKVLNMETDVSDNDSISDASGSSQSSVEDSNEFEVTETDAKIVIGEFNAGGVIKRVPSMNSIVVEENRDPLFDTNTPTMTGGGGYGMTSVGAITDEEEDGDRLVCMAEHKDVLVKAEPLDIIESEENCRDPLGDVDDESFSNGYGVDGHSLSVDEESNSNHKSGLESGNENLKNERPNSASESPSKADGSEAPTSNLKTSASITHLPESTLPVFRFFHGIARIVSKMQLSDQIEAKKEMLHTINRLSIAREKRTM